MHDSIAGSCTCLLDDVANAELVLDATLFFVQARTKLTAVLKKFRRAGSNNEALSRQVLKLLAASPGVVSELDDVRDELSAWWHCVAMSPTVVLARAQVGDFPLHSALRHHAPATVLWPLLDGFPAAARVVSKVGSSEQETCCNLAAANIDDCFCNVSYYAERQLSARSCGVV